LNIIVRGDAKTKYKEIRAVLDLCQQANIAKVDLATESPNANQRINAIDG
jgi:biopolymer transport protein ExbD